MNDINIAIFLGRATKDIEVKKFKDRYRFSTSLALNYNNPRGNKVVNFVPIIMWSSEENHDIADLKKGDLVNTKGWINVRSYEVDNTKRWITEMVAEEVRIITTDDDAKAIKDLTSILDQYKDLITQIDESQDESILEKSTV